MVEYYPYDLDCVNDPFPVYARLRDEAPVYFNRQHDFWALSRYEDVAVAQQDTARFSNSRGVTLEGAEAGMPLLVGSDPPKHTSSKRVVAKSFSFDNMKIIEEFIRERTISILDRCYRKHGKDGKWDVFSEFALILPFTVISEILKIPDFLHEEILALSKHVLSRGTSVDPAQVQQAQLRILEIFIRLSKERRDSLGDDPVSTMIVRSSSDKEHDPISDVELAIRFYEMAFAGHDTTAKSLANGLIFLHDHPDQKKELLENMSLLPGAVEEVFRFDPPSHTQRRTPIVDVTIHGVTIPAESRLLLLTGSAARDPRAFCCPDVFDIRRKPDKLSIVFGNGAHKCLGVHLARLELSIALEEILSRYPKYRVDSLKAKRNAFANVRGVSYLPFWLG